HLGALADARPAYLGNRRYLAGCLPELWPATRSLPVHPRPRADLGPDRFPVHRQLHAVGAEPAFGGLVGTLALYSQATALRRHSGVCDDRDLGRLGLGIRIGLDGRARCGQLRDAGLRLSDSTLADRTDPGTSY